MRKVCILLVFLTCMYHDTWYRECKYYLFIYLFIKHISKRCCRICEKREYMTFVLDISIFGSETITLFENVGKQRRSNTALHSRTETSHTQ
jgi:hypothetical protein